MQNLWNTSCFSLHRLSRKRSGHILSHDGLAMGAFSYTLKPFRRAAEGCSWWKRELCCFSGDRVPTDPARHWLVKKQQWAGEKGILEDYMLLTEFHKCVISNWYVVCLSEFTGKSKSNFLSYWVPLAWKILHKKPECFFLGYPLKKIWTLHCWPHWPRNS